MKYWPKIWVFSLKLGLKSNLRSWYHNYTFLNRDIKSISHLKVSKVASLHVLISQIEVPSPVIKKSAQKSHKFSSGSNPPLKELNVSEEDLQKLIWK